MSGDNLHGKQPIKFYSEKITLTKVELLERQLSLGEKISDLDQKHKDCLLYTSPSPRDLYRSRMPSSA